MKIAKNFKSRGVTIIELATVLGALGIFLSIVFIGYNFFVKQSRLTKITIESSNYTKAITSFHSVYGAIPGDFASASKKINSNLVNGNGDGFLNTQEEQYQFWVHLSEANSIVTPSGGKYQRLAVGQTPELGVHLPEVNGIIGDAGVGVIYDNPSGTKMNSFIVGGLSGRQVNVPRISQEIIREGDIKFDDGNPITGGWMCGGGTNGLTPCDYGNTAQENENKMLYLPFSRTLSGSTTQCPAQSVALTVGSVVLTAYTPAISGGGNFTGNCRDANQDYKGTYTLSCALQTSGLYAVEIQANACAIKTCPAPTAIANANTPLSTNPVNVNQIYGFTCSGGLVSNNPICSAVQGTDTAQFSPAPACVSSAAVGTSGNIPVYSGTSTFTDSGKKFNDAGTTITDILTADKVYGLIGKTAGIQNNFIPKYSLGDGSLIQSLMHDSGTGVRVSDLAIPLTTNPQSVLELQSTTKGFLPPRVTSSQRDAITTPLNATQRAAAKGIMVFDTTLNDLYTWNGDTWLPMGTKVVDNMPVGAIVPFYGATIPDGWLLCDGATFQQADYPDLFTFLGNRNTVPDLRGLFLRGAGTGTAFTDTTLFTPVGPALKAKQGDAFKKHRHWISGRQRDDSNDTATDNSQDLGLVGDAGTYSVGDKNKSSFGRYSAWSNFSRNGTSSGGIDSPETRPMNIGVNYIIKAKAVSPVSLTISGTKMQAGTPHALIKFDAGGTKLVSTGVFESSSTGNIGIGTTTPNTSALLDVSSTTKGFLPPRMTTAQRTAVATPATGLVVYDTDIKSLYAYDGTAWKPAAGSTDAFLNGGNTFGANATLGTNDNFALSLKTNNAERMRITNAGNVGIGTTTPNTSAILDVSSTAKGFLPPRMTTAQRTAVATPATGLVVYDTDIKSLYAYDGTAWKPAAGSTDAFLNGGNTFGANAKLGTNDNFALAFETNNTERMRITNTGNVGIGTTTPTDKLAVISRDNVLTTNIISATSNNLTQGQALRWNGLASIGTNANVDLNLTPKGTGNVIVPNGNVGIGANKPAIKLAINDNDSGFDGGGGLIRMITNNTERMRITNAGKVGIGTTNPAIRLAINDTDSGFDGGGGLIRMITNNTERMRITSTGNVGIGTNAPAIQLALGDSDTGLRQNGDNRFEIMTNGRTRARFQNTQGNNIAWYDGDANWDFVSDVRLKKNIEDAEPVLEKVLKIKVRRFDYKDSTKKYKSIGVVSQELQPIFPDFITKVDYDEQRKMKDLLMVSYTDFGILSIKATQELAKKVEKLEEKLGITPQNAQENNEDVAKVEEKLELHTIIIYTLLGVVFVLLSVIAVLIRILFVRTKKL